jgi:hypothetical protein
MTATRAQETLPPGVGRSWEGRHGKLYSISSYARHSDILLTTLIYGKNIILYVVTYKSEKHCCPGRDSNWAPPKYKSLLE